MRSKVLALPPDLKPEPQLVKKSQEAFEQGKDGVWLFWSNFFKDGSGLRCWEILKADRAKAAQKVRLDQGVKTWAEKTGTVPSQKRRLDARAALLHQPEKRPRQDQVGEELPFAVYVEKFDSKQSRIKLSTPEWKQVRDSVFKAYWLESTNDKSEMKNGIKKVCIMENLQFSIQNQKQHRNL